MTKPLTPAARASLSDATTAVPVPATVPPETPPQRRTLMRKYEVLYARPNGDIDDFTKVAPATPAFEDAFAAFARGTLIATERGPVAIEDLLPGDEVKTVDDGYQPLLWRGCTSIVPKARGQAEHMGRLTRIAADALGIARPMPDLVLGPRARLYHRSQAIQRYTRGDGAFVPAREMVDGCNIIELTPMSAVPVYHLGFAAHHRIVACGVELESHHPGTLHEIGLRGETLELYLSLFPHVEEFADFGPLRYARLRMSDLQMMGVA
ncbi:hypothetical protein OG2516_14021 [Oceanicola granulosus HTCC2516]|uniref:Hedgehog/Intein (Hint) domain-containing protein n=1 Tax=Oceanicola granulosus (strain ATCC BAA-861 / DSM 15982 / KCTC 12143 / HTCC2516) TaxID=314256 RepID=Q2CAV0_OCEGH|nr:Hint domain-containing protein [Oceanicola granulosus]EAR49781.1 hypothetical protein OG2516_14021 [Oceanicola granulosus HTCC2516]